MTDFNSANSIQSKYFRNKSQVQSPLDNLGNQLSCLAKKALFINEEGFRGSMGDTAEIKKLRGSLKTDLDNINTTFSDKVLETGKLLDQIGKKVGEQEQILVDSLDKRMWNKHKPQLNNLAGRDEDSATFQRMGNSRFILYLLIAIVVLVITIFRMKINYDAYFVVGAILGILLLVIMIFFYGK